MMRHSNLINNLAFHSAIECIAYWMNAAVLKRVRELKVSATLKANVGIPALISSARSCAYIVLLRHYTGTNLVGSIVVIDICR